MTKKITPLLPPMCVGAKHPIPGDVVTFDSRAYSEYGLQ